MFFHYLRLLLSFQFFSSRNTQLVQPHCKMMMLKDCSFLSSSLISVWLHRLWLDGEYNSRQMLIQILISLNSIALTVPCLNGLGRPWWMSVAQICKTASWSAESNTFRKFYKRVLLQTEQSQKPTWLTCQQLLEFKKSQTPSQLISSIHLSKVFH